MLGVFTDALVALLAAILIVAAAGDLRTRNIPNALNLTIALLAIPYWWFAGFALWPDIPVQLALAIGTLLVFSAAFAIGWMGGGDVKMLAALALWLPPLALMKLLVVMSIAGGVLTVAMAVRHRVSRAEHKLEVPYGVAIAFGGFWLIGERFLNQFG